MSQTPHYEINLSHGELHICLQSDDVYFISKQMNQWLKIFLDDRYIPAALPQPPAPQPAPKPPKKPVETAAPPPVYPREPEPPPQVQTPPPPQPVYQREPEPVAVYEDDYVPPVVKPRPAGKPLPVHLPGETPVIQQPVAAEYDDSPPPPAVLKDDFETVMDTLMRDLNDDDEEAPPSRPAYAAKFTTPRRSALPVLTDDYEQGTLPVGVLDNEPPYKEVLEERLPDRPIDSLADLCDRARAATSEDYLILSAYFLTFFEGADKFSLKRINAMLVRSGLTPVNHSVLESSVANRHLAMVADLTGMAEVSEYTLTEQGRQYADGLM